MLHATLTSCLLKEKRKEATTVRAGRRLFRKPSSNFYIVSQREVSGGLAVISAVPGEEKYRGVVWEGPLTQFTIRLARKL